MTTSRISISILSLTLLVCVWTALVDAQVDDMSGFAVSSDSQAILARAGTTVSRSMGIVVVRTQRATRFEIEVTDLGQDAQGSTRPVPVGTGTRSCAPWLRIDNRAEIAAGGGTRVVPFDIDVPADARGAYYAYINVRLAADRSGQDQTAMFIEPVLSVKVELEIEGQSEVTINTTDVSYQHDLGNGDAGVLISIQNDGNIKSTFEGDVLLYSPKRRFPIRGAIPLGADGKPMTVYPGSSISVRCPLDEPASAGDYRAEVRLRMMGQWRSRSTFDITVPSPGRLSLNPSRSISKSEFDLDVSVEPGFLEVSLPSGASRFHTIRIKNRDTLTVVGKTQVYGMIQEVNGFLTYVDLSDTSKSWIKVEPTEWTLRPNSETVLRLNITAPEFGDARSVVRAVRILGSAGVDQTNWSSEVDIGVPIIAVPAGAGPAELEISKFEIVRGSDEVNPTAVKLRVVNTGGKTAELRGKLVLERAGSRQVIQTASFSAAEGLILSPGGIREFNVPLPVLDKDRFRARVELTAANEPSASAATELTFLCSQGPN